jgi:hypothetical protein
MSETVKKKTVSFSQFSKWFTCPYQWYRDYILKEKTFEDSLHMSFGTGIHEAIQNYLVVLYKDGELAAQKVDSVQVFTDAFQREVTKKSIPNTPEEMAGFIEDGKNILAEFLNPVNIRMNFNPAKWELLAIEDDLNEGVRNNLNLTGKLDVVLREKATGNIRIIDFKTSGRGWNSYQKEDFTKTSQLVLYKALYSKRNNLPLSKIKVEFIILKRQLYDAAKSNFPQTRVDVFVPSSHQNDVMQVIQEFGKFTDACFTPEGQYKVDAEFPKIPGKAKKNCKYCPYLKNGKCDAKATKAYDV